MKIFDITAPISEGMTVYKNLVWKKPKIKTVSDFSTGNVFESEITMNLHTGTHVDMPLHMIEGGETSNGFDITKLISNCKVLEFTGSKEITKEMLMQKDISQGDFLLFKTDNSFCEEFLDDFTYLRADGAEYLVQKGISGVGTDALGIERSQPDHRTHKQLMNAGIIILEGLRLKEVPEGIYKMITLPLKIVGVESLPATSVLIQE